MIRQTVLPFKLETTNDLITSHAGLALFGEFAVGLGLKDALDMHVPGPGNGSGYLASEHVFPLILMLNGGDPSLGFPDLRIIPPGDGERRGEKFEIKEPEKLRSFAGRFGLTPGKSPSGTALTVP